MRTVTIGTTMDACHSLQRCLHHGPRIMDPQSPTSESVQPPSAPPEPGTPVAAEAPGFNRFYTRVFALCTALLLGIACYQIVKPFLGPLLWAISFAFLLHPVHVSLTRRLRNRVDQSALLLTLLACVALLGPLAAFGAAFVNQTSALLQYLQGFISDEAHNDMQQLTSHPQLQSAWHWMEINLGITLAQLRGWLGEATRSVLQVFASTSGKLFLGAVGGAVGLFLTLFLLFFFIRDGAAMLATTVELIPMPPAKRQALSAHLAAVMRAVMFGTALTAVLHGALVAIAFLIVGLPSPLVFGTLAGLLGLLPVGGTAFVWLPAAIVLAIQDRWVAAIFMLLWGALLVSMIDNFLKPLLISGRAPIATLTVFLGVLGGVAAFGAIGLFLGPVVLALAVALIHFALDTRRENERLRTTTPNL
jgi:predicted PurR-regulated permease PerM